MHRIRPIGWLHTFFMHLALKFGVQVADNNGMPQLSIDSFEWVVSRRVRGVLLACVAMGGAWGSWRVNAQTVNPSAQVRPTVKAVTNKSEAMGVSMSELADLLDQKITEVAARRSAAPVVQVKSAGTGRTVKPSKVHADAAPVAGRDVPWAYTGATGPDSWGRLNPEYRQCMHGKRQSPIDLRDGLPVQLDALDFEYPAVKLTVQHADHTVQAVPDGGARLRYDGRVHILQHVSFRYPGEVTIDGVQSVASLHLLHRDAQGHMVMVAVPLIAGQANASVQQVWNNLPLERHLRQRTQSVVDLRGFVPAASPYMLYMGSLSTPPCTEGVVWAVMKQGVEVSDAQLQVLAKLYPYNARPVQAGHGRLIKDGQ